MLTETEGMRILVTGGTGFLGAHIVASLVGGGHRVHLLARRPAGIAPALAPLGVDGCSHTVGDVTDPGAVRQAMAGCDAVVHAAAIYSLDGRARKQLRETNVVGTRIVLEAARDLGASPVVYVSSLVALFPPEGRVLTPRSPVKHPPGAYYGSKAEAERVARRFQDDGMPLTIVYPSAVQGPHDPHTGESVRLLGNILRGRFPAIPGGGLNIVDVRDVALAIAAISTRSRGPRRYVLSGTYTSLGGLIDRVADLTGRDVRYRVVPTWSLWPLAWSADLMQRFLPWRIPFGMEGLRLLAWDPRADDSLAREELGFSPRPLRETLADTLRWMHEAGHVTAGEAGSMATAGFDGRERC
jgi:dihydroflavonol-4-reductase